MHYGAFFWRKDQKALDKIYSKNRRPFVNNVNKASLSVVVIRCPNSCSSTAFHFLSRAAVLACCKTGHEKSNQAVVCCCLLLSLF